MRRRAGAGSPDAAAGMVFAALCLIWGTTFLAIKVVQRWLPPLTLGGVQTIVAGALLLALLRLQGTLRRPPAAAWRRGLAGGVLFFLVGNGSVYLGIDEVPSGLAALLVGSIPLFSAVLEWSLGELAPSRPMVAGLALAAGGLIWLVAPDLAGGAGPLNPAGVGWLLLGSLAWAVGGLVMRRWRAPGPALESPALQMLIGGVLSAGAGGTLGEWPAIRPDAFSAATAGALGYLVIMGSLLAFIGYLWLVSVWSPSRASAYAFVNPVVALFVGWALGGEVVGPRTLAAAAVIVAGVALITLSPAGDTIRRSAGSYRKRGGAPASASAPQGGRDA